MDKRIDWLLIAIIAFLGGVVANIVAPTRRGVLGFVSAAVVGIFCGGVAGLAANSYGASPGAQYLLSAFCGVMGDRLLSALLERFKNTPSSPTHVSVHGGINNIGQTGIQGNQHCE